LEKGLFGAFLIVFVRDTKLTILTKPGVISFVKMILSAETWLIKQAWNTEGQ